MGLVAVTARLLGGLACLLVLATAAFVDRDDVQSVLEAPRRRLSVPVWHVALLGGVLVVNRLFRHRGQELSWIIGWNITGAIYALEGRLVLVVQSVATPLLTAYFSSVYLYGYAFVTVFPLVAYALHHTDEHLERTILAYAVNYALGLLFYTLFISYGPRNLLPQVVDPLLYVTYPETQLLTSKINTNTNVFPSLHTSLSVTAFLLAARTRDDYPGWYLVTVPLVGSIVVSTMYLGIHWATDVAAGVVLAVVSVRVADRYHELRGVRELVSRPRRR